jgi:hypothetical protein
LEKVNYFIRFLVSTFPETPQRHVTHASFQLNIWNNQQIEYTHITLAETIKLCCNINLNDWQHWHLGKTLTWTPLRDVDLFKLFARLQLSDLKEQVMNSIVQRRLIEKNNPKILTYLSTQKNSVNYLENLTNLLDLGSNHLI